MARFAVINKQGDVINCIEWDEIAQWAPPIDHIIVKSNEANRGDLYDFEKKTFTLWHQRTDYIAPQE